MSKNLCTFINFYSKVESVNLSRERGSFRKYNDSLCGQENQNYILQAYNKGLNGITFFRDKCLEVRNIDMEEKER